jgi:hypothetical protein
LNSLSGLGLLSSFVLFVLFCGHPVFRLLRLNIRCTMTPLPADRVLEQSFHEARSKLLDVAAIVDRLGRGAGADATMSDPRAQKLRQAIELLLGDAPNKAELLQELFSLPYDPQWQRPQPRF